MSLDEPQILSDELQEAPPTLGTPSRGRGRPRGSTAKAKSTQVDQLQLVILSAAGLKLCTVLLAWRLQYPPLLMSDKEANDIAKPLSRIIGRSALMRVYGKYLAGSSDYVALGIALYSYGERVWAQTQVIAASNMQAKREASSNNGHESRRYAPTPEPATTTAGFADGFTDLTPGRD